MIYLFFVSLALITIYVLTHEKYQWLIKVGFYSMIVSLTIFFMTIPTLFQMPLASPLAAAAIQSEMNMVLSKDPLTEEDLAYYGELSQALYTNLSAQSEVAFAKWILTLKGE